MNIKTTDENSKQPKKKLFSWFSKKKQNNTDEPSPMDQEASAKQESSAGKEPLASQEPLAKQEPSTIDEPSVAPIITAEQTPLVEPELPQVVEKIAEHKDSSSSDEPKVIVSEEPKPISESLFGRLKSGLRRTRGNFSEGLANLFLGKKTIDDDLLEELETSLLMADVGVDATREIIKNLTEKVSRKELVSTEALAKALRKEMAELLQKVEKPLNIPKQDSPYVILMVGVNGVGKTTTIGKLASKLKAEGHSVMLAAGDTFRAAAVEQLQVWGERNEIPVIAQHTGADSASVIFDALESARAKKIDVLIADTAGRLHTRDNLMEELTKVKRVMGKLDGEAPHEVMLVLDAGTGQNAINQAEQFHQCVALTGLTLTKLDGTAKGGVIFSIAKNLEIPVRFIGIGEGIDDLRPFNSKDFIDALFSDAIFSGESN